MNRVEQARALISKVCDRVGFPVPTQEKGLAAWADECLDDLLVRGSPAWNEAHVHTIEALDAALVGNETLVATQLEFARDIARKVGAEICACERPIHVAEHGRHCFRCYRKVKSA